MAGDPIERVLTRFLETHHEAIVREWHRLIRLTMPELATITPTTCAVSLNYALKAFHGELEHPDLLAFPVLSARSGSVRLQTAARDITERHLDEGYDLFQLQSAYYLMQQAIVSVFDQSGATASQKIAGFGLIDHFTKQLTIAMAKSYLDHETERLEKTVADRTRELRETLQKQDDFVTFMSHEIRTALTTIIGTTDLVLDLDPHLSEDTRHYLELIPRSGELINRLVTDILDYAKLAAGQITMRFVRLNLLEAVKDTVALAASKLERAGVNVEVDLSLDLPDVRADQIRLQQVLLNLLTNAIKFSPRGSDIQIRGDMAGSDMVQVAVVDQGPGISAHDQVRIFERFQQIDSEVTRRQGTGLGLAISRLIVQQHGGCIGVQSLPGRGSRFYFTLPVYHEGHDAPPSGAHEFVCHAPPAEPS